MPVDVVWAPAPLRSWSAVEGFASLSGKDLALVLLGNQLAAWAAALAHALCDVRAYFSVENQLKVGCGPSRISNDSNQEGM